MLISPDLKIFGTVPEDRQQPGRGPFARIVVLGSAPKVFMQATLLAVDVVSIVWAFLIVFTMQHSPVVTIITIEVLFVASVILLTLARRSAHFSVVLACYGITLVLSTLLNVLFPGSWGDFGLLAVCGFAMYR